jgi:hypothetical protein
MFLFYNLHNFFAADEFPVLAFTGAPAPFPVQPENIPIQVKIKQIDTPYSVRTNAELNYFFLIF